MPNELIWVTIGNLGRRMVEWSDRHLDYRIRPVAEWIQDMNTLAVGDRVCKKGMAWKGEHDRFGTVVEVYHGIPSVIQKGTEMLAVKFEDTEKIERGFIQGSGSLLRHMVVASTASAEGGPPEGRKGETNEHG